MNEQKVLVTVGAGYIGSQASKTLQLWRYILVTFDNLVRGYKDTIIFDLFKLSDLKNEVVRRSDLLKEHGLELSVSFEN